MSRATKHSRSRNRTPRLPRTRLLLLVGLLAVVALAGAAAVATEVGGGAKGLVAAAVVALTLALIAFVEWLSPSSL